MITINEYFNGSVKSLAYESPEGKSTIGVIESGEYEFGTSQHETMLVIEGDMDVLLPGQSTWQTFGKGQSFEIAAGNSFKVKNSRPVSYLCKYR